MKITKVWIDWMENYSNSPSIYYEVDKYDQSVIDKMKYEQRGSLYFAENKGFVSFFSYSAPGGGYGGREFPINMKDGSKKTLKGPWSSRSGCMNFAGFTPCVEAVVKIAEHSYCHLPVTLSMIKPFIDKMKDVFLITEELYGSDIVYTPSLHPTIAAKPFMWNKKKRIRVMVGEHKELVLTNEQFKAYRPKTNTTKQWGFQIPSTMSGEQSNIMH